MPCLPCLTRTAVAGEEDSHKPDAFTLTIRLSTGAQISVYALPTDTVSDIRRKVQRLSGIQPDISVRGHIIPPPILASYQGKWFPVRPDATILDLDLQTHLRFASVTDKLNRVENVSSTLPWAASSAFVWDSP